MKILSTLDKSRPGNDCYIVEFYHLVEINCSKYVLGIYITTGWNQDTVATINPVEDVDKKLVHRLMSSYNG